LLLLDLGRGSRRLGGSALAQVYSQLGDEVPDLHSANDLKQFFGFIQAALEQRLLLAYHDRSDGGLIVTLLEMAFAGHCGLQLNLDQACQASLLEGLFAEELGAVVQVLDEQLPALQALAGEYGMADICLPLGRAVAGDGIELVLQGKTVLQDSRTRLHRLWAETSWRMQALRDNSACAQQEYDALLDQSDPGLHAVTSYALDEDIAAPAIKRGQRPRIAVLREQGVNGQLEMAAAFHRAGFDAVDVHMSDIISGRVSLESFKALAACGGFSYGDVLGAGEGWAKSILFNARARDEFERFFTRDDTLGLGVCNGCQMMSNLRELIPGADHWPRFVRNASEQFEGRTTMVLVDNSPSAFLAGMQGSRFPIAIAHGEGQLQSVLGSGSVALRYLDNYGKVTEAYPANPNGSPAGIAGLCSNDGRFTIMMPHPERVFRAVTNSHRPDEWQEDGPTMRMFRNARVWLD
jgi:phosphoribosylformylglycinamidine synthase